MLGICCVLPRSAKMVSSKTTSSLILLAAILITTFSLVQGIPNIRSTPSKKSSNEVEQMDHRNRRASCRQHIPCGFAYYRTSNTSSRFRPIIKYDQNYLCSCDEGMSCVLTDNRSERKAYVFHCRRSEQSRHMFLFPRQGRR